MPLGLAKDSMLNLAEMANQREIEEDVNSEEKVNSEIKLEDGEEETLVMHLATHEIEALDETDFEESKDEISTKPRLATGDNSKDSIGAPATAIDMGDDGGLLHSDPQAKLGSTASSDSLDKEEPPPTADSFKALSYGNYSGFSTDYSEYEHYSSYDNLQLLKKDDQPFWCCLFPWIRQLGDNDDSDPESSSFTVGEPGQESMIDLQVDGRSGSLSRVASKDDDEVSTGSDILGERLSEKDRQAVLARLRLAEPDIKGATSPPMGEEGISNAPTVAHKGLLKEVNMSEENDFANLPSKSILKRPSTLSGANLIEMSGNSSNDGKGKARRSLFPSYETTNKSKKDLHVEFSPMARVLTVKSHKDMDEKEKGEIWWQRSDYEEFRKTGRMITRAMLEGGSEIWLATNQSWQLPNKDKHSTLKNAFSLAEQQAKFQKGDISAKKKYEETRDKWWHRFGHSRRGLEHIASIDEGRQRQGNVRTALRSVIEEQRRQKVFHREDAEKLRMVSIQHTSWARDLALAAGASDADAVQMNFDDGSRKSREFYLLKFSRSNQMTVNTTKKASVPAFMKPALSFQVQGSKLDAHTAPQIRYRQVQHRRRASVAPAPTEKLKDKAEPIKMIDDLKTSSNMAKQAAGFASGEEIGNMSAVLTGMGATSIPA